MAIPANLIRILFALSLVFIFILCNCSRETPEDNKSASKQTSAATSTSTNTASNATANTSYYNTATQVTTDTSVFTTTNNNNTATTLALLNSFMTLLFGTSLPTGGVVNQTASLYQTLNCQNNGFSAPLSITLAPNNMQTKSMCATNAAMQIGSLSVNGACRNVANGSTMPLGTFCAQNGIN